LDSSTTATIRVGAVSIRFLVEADDSGGSVTVFECLVPAGVKVPVPHSHDAFEETIYGLEGVSTWTIDGQARNRPWRFDVHPPRPDPRVPQSR
jgi:quercetin dioxygenase-like cupin family protein